MGRRRSGIRAGRGIRVTESRPTEECEFTDLITVTAGNDKEKVTVHAILAPERKGRAPK